MCELNIIYNNCSSDSCSSLQARCVADGNVVTFGHNYPAGWSLRNFFNHYDRKKFDWQTLKRRR